MTTNADALPSMTEEDVSDWIANVENTATMARDTAFANRFLLSNLLLHLNKTGVLNAHAFLLNLQGYVAVLPESAERMAAQEYLDELLPEFSYSSRASGGTLN